MTNNNGPAAGYSVADLKIDVGRHAVTRGSEEIPLPGLSFDLLLALAKASPNMLTYDQLMEHVWSPAVVNVETVNQRVKLVRNALGDDPRKPRYILSVHGRGYRLIPDATPLRSAVASAPKDAAAPVSNDAIVIPVKAPRPGRRPRWIIASVAGVLALGLAAFFWPTRQTESTGTPWDAVAEADPTIAVLPFVNLSSNPDDVYFADGLSEEVMNRLALLPGLQVAARTSAFHFKGKSEDVKEIGRRLGVQHVLEGSVRREGDRVRVSVHLSSTRNGYRLWSETFDRRMESAFEIQEKVAEAVAAKLALRFVADGTQAPATHRLTNDAEALDLYLRARHLYQSWERERIDKAIELFDKAVAIDPTFAEAYVALAEAYMAKTLTTGCCEPSPYWEKRGQMLRRALELDPNNANAIAGIGLDYMYAWEFEAAEKYLRRAEALNPNGEFVLRSLTWYYTDAGWPPQDALKYAQRFYRLDPLNPFASLVVCQAHLASGQYEQAVAAADRMVELNPDYWPGHVFRSMALALVGRHAEALEASRRAIEITGAKASGGLQLGVIDAYARMGKIEEAARVYALTEPKGGRDKWEPTERAYALALLFRWEEALTALERAFQARSGALLSTLTADVFIPIHDEPRFRKIVTALKFERRIEFARRVAEARHHVVAER